MEKLVRWLKSWFRDPEEEFKDSMSPCPICGHKAVLIRCVSEESGVPIGWHVECGAFNDHGAWTLPDPCNFMGVGYSGFLKSRPDRKEKLFISCAKAVKWWNEVVVPICKEAKEAIERVENASPINKESRKDVE